jgi:energy-coupling factor transport system ATP-binding protein
LALNVEGLVIEPGSFVVVCGLTSSRKGEFIRNLRPSEPGLAAGGDSPFLADMLSLLGAGELVGRDPATLSGGQRQRLSLAAKLARQVPNFALDEPTAHLDPAAALLLLGFLVRLNREQGATVVISDRHLEELFPHCERVLLFVKDRLVFDGNVQDFIVGTSANAAAFTSALPANVTIPLIRHMKSSADQGHDAMAGTYLVARYPISVAEARERLATWPEVEAAAKAAVNAVAQLDDAAQSAADAAAAADAAQSAADDAAGAAAVAAEAAPETAAEVDSAVLVEAGGLRLIPGRSLALMGDNASGKSRLLESLGGQAAERGVGALALCQQARGGEDQLAALTAIVEQAEAASPGVLLLDEPTAAVDFATARKLAKRLAALKASGWSIVIATQDLEFAAIAADSCVMLANGRLSKPLPPQDFFDNALLYTTVVNRVTRGYFDRCVNLSDLSAHL